jgi:hypothetical protein
MADSSESSSAEDKKSSMYERNSPVVQFGKVEKVWKVLGKIRKIGG